MMVIEQIALIFFGAVMILLMLSAPIWVRGILMWMQHSEERGQRGERGWKDVYISVFLSMIFFLFVLALLFAWSWEG